MSNAQLAGQYYTQFQAKKSIIDNLLAPNTTADSTTAAQEIRSVKKSLTEATAFLPPYDQRRYQDQIKEWERALLQSGSGNGEAAKKPRFTFKKRAGGTPTPTGVEETDASLPTRHDKKATNPSTPLARDSPVDASPTPQSEQITLRGTTDRQITLDQLLATHLDAGERTGFSLVLEDIQGCVIDLRDRAPSDASDGNRGQGKRLTALYGANVRDSVIVVPEDVAGSVMFDRMERVIVVTGCQQFRIHSSSHAILLLQIPSNPITEHSSSLRFGRYPSNLRNVPSSSASRYADVQDFGWIKPGPSPNFEVLADEVADEVGGRIKEVLDGREGWKERLQAVLEL